MIGTLKITLAGEPKGKGRPRFARASGRAYTPGPTRSYEGQLKHVAYEEMRGRTPFDGPVTVRMLAVFAIPESMSKGKRALALTGQLRPTKAPDSDNILKVTDALNNVVWRDDKQVVEASVSKFYGERPRLEIVVSPFVADDTESAAQEIGRGIAGSPAVDRLAVGRTATLSPRATGVPA